MLMFSPNILLRKGENFIKFWNRFKINQKLSIFWSLFGYDLGMKEATVNFVCFAIGILNPKIFCWHFFPEILIAQIKQSWKAKGSYMSFTFKGGETRWRGSVKNFFSWKIWQSGKLVYYNIKLATGL